MTDGHNTRHNPADYKEIARGSGPAAILLFLHIAIVGYLGSIVYYLLKGNASVFWTLVPFSSAIFYYLPAAFALFTAMPTNPLTRTVARVAQGAGVLALLVYGGGLIYQALNDSRDAISPGIQTAAAIVAGVAGGLLLRVIFRLGIPANPENEKKTVA